MPVPAYSAGVAILAKGSIVLGPGSLVDSFNSSNPLHSSNGLYVVSMAESNALVLTDGNGTGIVIAYGTIDGSASTGPTGTVRCGSNGIVTGTVLNDANVQINDPPAPFTYGTGTVPLPPALTRAPPVNYLLVGGNYNMSGLYLSGASEMAVTGGNNVLYINGNPEHVGSWRRFILPPNFFADYLCQ